MISALDIRERASEWGLSPDVVEKDYVNRERQPAVERRMVPRPVARPVLGHQVDVRVG
jgi:hypothetical protein